MSRYDDVMVQYNAYIANKYALYDRLSAPEIGSELRQPVDPSWGLFDDTTEISVDGVIAFNTPAAKQKFFYNHGFMQDGYEYHSPRFSNLYYLSAPQQWARQYNTDTSGWTVAKIENGYAWYDTGFDRAVVGNGAAGSWDLSAGVSGGNDGMIGDSTIGRIAIAAILGAPFAFAALGVGLSTVAAEGVIEGAVIGDLSGFGASEFVTSDMVSEALANGVLTAEQAASTLEAIQSAAPITGVTVPSTENITYTYDDGSTATLNADGSATATPATDPGVPVGNSVGDKVIQTIKDKAVSTGVNQAVSTGVKAVTGSTAPGQQNIQRAYTNGSGFPSWFDPVATPDQAKPAASPLLIFGLIFMVLGGG